jgi:hypothetical protein
MVSVDCAVVASGFASCFSEQHGFFRPADFRVTIRYPTAKPVMSAKVTNSSELRMVMPFVA